MRHITLELSRLAFVLFVRGVFLIVLGGVAIRWPEQTLLLSMIAAGGIVGSLGIFELAAGAISRALPSTKLFLIGHGVISIAYGALTASIPVALPSLATGMATVFSVIYGVFSLVLAARLQFVPRAREAVAGWAILNFGAAAILAAGTFPTTNALLYAGALYGAILGLFQLFAALWIRRALEPVERGGDHHGLAAS